VALDVVQVEDVRRGVFELRLGDLLGAPVRALLLLREIDIEQLAYQVLESMPVGVSTDKLARDNGRSW
jgi:hypothetical protein